MAMLNYFFANLLKHHGLLAIYAQDGNPDPEPIKLDPVGTALTLTIICIYIIVSGLVNDSCTSHRRSRADYETQLTYTILEVVAILVMIENVRTPFVVGEADEPLLSAENPDPRWGLAPTSGPVTSGIRNTLTYLRAEAGILSIFRGLGYYIICLLGVLSQRPIYRSPPSTALGICRYFGTSPYRPLDLGSQQRLATQGHIKALSQKLGCSCRRTKAHSFRAAGDQPVGPLPQRLDVCHADPNDYFRVKQVHSSR